MSIGEHFRDKSQKTLPTYPPDHQVGIRVPKGGSDCAKCEYLKDAAKQLCGNKDFIAWNGGPKFDAPADEFCCDFFEAEE